MRTMNEWSLNTPVTFLIFNRPMKTEQVFERIAEMRPPQLFVVADGPRPGNQKDEENCRLARAVISQVDWKCDVITSYRESNLGCRKSIAEGLSWVFKNTDRAIILEDDCLPQPSFFRFCEELLNRYEEHTQIMHISGDNFQGGLRTGPFSYYFSKYTHVWGWATWRRAWAQYDPDMRDWPNVLASGRYLKWFEKREEAEYWKAVWNRVHFEEFDTWDYQWFYACRSHGSLAVMPETNLVANIGMDSEGRHLRDRNHPMARLPVGKMIFPLRHPQEPFEEDRGADERTRMQHFITHSIITRVKRRLGRLRDVLLNKLSGRFVRASLFRVRSIFTRGTPGTRWNWIRRSRRISCWCGGSLTSSPWHKSYSVCSSCGTFVNHRPPVVDDLRAFYSLNGYWKDRQRLRGLPSVEQRAKRYLDDGRLQNWLNLIGRYGPASGTAIEVGCAPGILLDELGKRGYVCLGVEASEDTVQWLKDRWHLDVRAGLFPDVELPACDLFISMDVLEHSEDPGRFMVEAARLLNSGGTALIQTAVDREAQKPPFGDSFHNAFDDLEHLFLFTPKAMQSLADRAGLEILSDQEGLWVLGEIYVLRKP